MGSLQEQLLKAGLISAEQLEQSRTKKKPGGQRQAQGQGQRQGQRSAAQGQGRQGKPAHSGAANAPGDRRATGAQRNAAKRPHGAGAKTAQPQNKSASGEPSLEEAYRARQQVERDEEQRTRQRQQREQEARRQRNLKLDEIVKDQIRNDPDADIRRYFEYGGRIRHLYVNAQQLQQLAEGQLGIVVLRGRYLILEQTAVDQFKSEASDLVPDLSKETVAPEEAEAVSTSGPDVPDDLRW